MIAENRSWKYSLLLHFALFLVAAFGLPAILPESQELRPLVMTVDILPISEITNVKPSQKPIQEKKAPAKPLPKPKEPPKPKPAPKEEVKEKPFDPEEEAEVVDKKKPEPKKEEPKKQEEKSFEDLLKDLKKDAEKTEEKGKDQEAQEENKTISEAPYDNTMPLSLSEEDALRSAYIPCWSPPAGGMNAEKQIVVVRAQYRPDGALIDAQIDSGQKGRYNSDVAFRTAADAAMRAVKHPTCNPLKNLPTSVYAKLKDTKITFDPRLMLQ